MKQRVTLAMALAVLVSIVHWTTAAGGSSLSDAGAAVANLPTNEGHEEKPLLCADASTEPEGFDCGPIILADSDEPPIDMRPVNIETVDA